MPAELANTEEPVLYLEGLMAPSFAAAMGLELAAPPLDWLPGLPERFRKRHIVLTTLAEARAGTDPLFIKPVNDKAFPADIYRGSELPADFEAQMPVLVSEVVEWTSEFRCFILDRRVVTHSIYLRDGNLQTEQDYHASEQELASAADFARELLEDDCIPLPRAAVLDVGVIRGRGWAVVEQNSAWGSGIYGCDPAKVLQVLRLAVASAGSSGAR